MWRRWARSSVLVVVVALSSASLAGCYTVTEIQPRELPKLDLHQEGRPPVHVHTVDGDKVEIQGDFKEARIHVGGEWTSREIVLKPPFRADSQAGDVYILRHGRVIRLDPDRISRVEIVQRDGGRTGMVLGAAGVAALAGLLLLSAMQSDDHVGHPSGGSSCTACAPVAGVFVGATAFFVVALSTSQSN